MNLALVRGLISPYRLTTVTWLASGRPFKPIAHGDELMAQAQAEFARARPALEKVLGVPSEGTIAAEARESVRLYTSPKPRRTKRQTSSLTAYPH